MSEDPTKYDPTEYQYPSIAAEDQAAGAEPAAEPAEEEAGQELPRVSMGTIYGEPNEWRDPEIEAMAVTIDALEALDEAAQRRVLSWAEKRLGIHYSCGHCGARFR